MKQAGSFHLTQKLEPPYKTPSSTLEVNMVKYSSYVNVHCLFPELRENNKSVITEMRRIPIGVLG